jgi:ribonuclease BN (tRNA processing enzyme)
LRVVGSGPALPRPGSACTCYLAESADGRVVLDLGSGAVGKLLEVVAIERLDAIVISHMHADHFFDLVPLRYGLKAGRPAPRGRLPLFLPPGGGAALATLRDAVAVNVQADFFERYYAVEEYDPTRDLCIADMRLRFRRTRHYVDAYAVRVESGGAAITYSADTAPSDEVVELARATSLFLCEAALGLGSEQDPRGHLSAQEAALMAAQADAKRLVLTHYPATWPPAALARAAQAVYRGPVGVAQDGDAYAL